MSNTIVTVGILSYKDQKYLEKGLPALLSQTYPHVRILVCDNNEDPNFTIKNWITKNFPTIEVLNAGGNVGFGKGHNYLMQNTDSPYYLCFNSDMYASPDYIQKLVEAMESNPNTAVVTGKLLKWANFPDDPTAITQNYIDTVGVQAYKKHFFKEVGSGQKDIGQFDYTKEIWGCSGASPMFNMELLKKIQHSDGEFYDKLFFMYKEDIDLMYRLQWAGFKCLYTHLAIAWHDRTVSDTEGFLESLSDRKSRPDYVKKNSYLNHLILVYKNWSDDYSLSTQIQTILFLLKYTLYLLIFDFKVLKVIREFLKYKSEILAKKKSMPRLLTAEQMESRFI